MDFIYLWCIIFLTWATSSGILLHLYMFFEALFCLGINFLPGGTTAFVVWILLWNDFGWLSVAMLFHIIGNNLYATAELDLIRNIELPYNCPIRRWCVIYSKKARMVPLVLLGYSNYSLLIFWLGSLVLLFKKWMKMFQILVEFPSTQFLYTQQ